MKIIVLVKHVPIASKVEINQNSGNLIREGTESIINPDDLNAIEASISLRDSHNGHVIAISMGPNQSIDALSEAIGMGADRGILLSDKAFSGADTWATSNTLGKAIEHLGRYDLILSGRQAIDGDTAQVGPQVAAFLSIPQVTCVFDIESVSQNSINVKRKTEEGYERINCSLPALISVNGEINKPRYPNILKLASACQKKAQIEVWNAKDIGVKVSEVGMKGSLTQVINTTTPKLERKGQILTGSSDHIIETLLTTINDHI